MDRRRFFREGLRELLRPLADGIAPLENVLEQLHRLDVSPSQRPPGAWLRPPGALPERDFVNTCGRCGNCVRACPAQCIKIDQTGVRGAGVPYIDPVAMPCVVCDGLVCMRDCPSGALVPTALGLLDMGTAVWTESSCVRSRGEQCTICIDQCPIGAVAIELRNNRIHVIEDGCIGCGVCENHCPTNPKSIVVVLRSARPGA